MATRHWLQQKIIVQEERFTNLYTTQHLNGTKLLAI